MAVSTAEVRDASCLVAGPLAAPGTSPARFMRRRNPTHREIEDGQFAAEDYGQYSMMKYKGSELAPLGTFEKKIPADIVTKVRAKEKAILDGKFTVKVDDNQPKSTAK